MLSRRHFLFISASAALMPAASRAAQMHVATGIALGAKVTLRLAHPEAPVIAARAMAEIDRLEEVFSLYRDTSTISRLNRDGEITEPPLEFLECLSIARAVHHASGGMFDPTVQPLWLAYANTARTGHVLSAADRVSAHARTGWANMALGADRIVLGAGMALTLNGIAQGYIADRVAALLRNAGLSDILIDTGELVALGGQPQGGSWPVQLAVGGEVGLRSRALATSAPLGMTFGNDGKSAHILDPLSGQPVTALWRGISISAKSAALADALSTAACLMQREADIARLCDQFADVRLEAAVHI